MSENKGVHTTSSATNQDSNSQTPYHQVGSQNSQHNDQRIDQLSDDFQRDLGSVDASLNAKRNDSNKGRRNLIIAAIAVLVVAVLIGVYIIVSSREKANQSNNSTLSIGLRLAPANLDIRNQSGAALEQALIDNVYEGLVSRDSENNIVPRLAKSWDISDDGLTYVFYLHENMTFSNGDVLDANDVVWSIQQLIDEELADSDQLHNVVSISADDNVTVRLELSMPYADTLWALSGRAGLVLDEEADYDLKTQAIGSGPYTVSSFNANESLVLEANTKYWGEDKPHISRIELRYYSDANAGLNALKSGAVQVLAPIEGTMIDAISDNPNYTVVTGEGTDKFVLAMNNASGVTSNMLVRQAIRYGIDHDDLIAAHGDLDLALAGPITKLDPGYEDLTDLYPYDLKRAQELMNQLGYNEDHRLTLRLEYASNYGSELGDQLRSQLAKIYIDLDVRVVEFSAWLQDVYSNRDYDLSIVDHNEPHDVYQWADPTYYYGYDNEGVQNLYAQAMASTDESQKNELLASMARIISQDAAADWLYNYRITTVYRNDVKNFPVNLNQIRLLLRSVSIG